MSAPFGTFARSGIKQIAPMNAPVRLTDEQLRHLADDSFEVMNWARRNGMRREQQLDEVVKAFRVRLGYDAPAEGEAR